MQVASLIPLSFENLGATGSLVIDDADAVADGARHRMRRSLRRPDVGEEERHWAAIKVWRSTDMLDDVQTTPLAVCDIRTVAPEDMIDNDGQNTGDIKMYLHARFAIVRLQWWSNSLDLI